MSDKNNSEYKVRETLAEEMPGYLFIDKGTSLSAVAVVLPKDDGTANYEDAQKVADALNEKK